MKIYNVYLEKPLKNLFKEMYSEVLQIKWNARKSVHVTQEKMEIKQRKYKHREETENKKQSSRLNP